MKDHAIGGYFAREPAGTEGGIHVGALKLNSGRSCLEYLIEAASIAELWVPLHTCGAIYDVLERTGVSIRRYTIDIHLDPIGLPPPAAGVWIIYNNYFGLKDATCDRLAATYGDRLIVDAAQALYFVPRSGAHVFYSPRKFAGLPDGGLLNTALRIARLLERDTSDRRLAHLDIRKRDGAEAGYPAYQAAEQDIGMAPLQRMSALTESMIDGINFDAIRVARQHNYAALHKLIGHRNGFELAADGPGAGPLAYPFAGTPEIRDKLIAARVFVPRYWPETGASPHTIERWLADNVLPLPIDQRYGREDINKIAAIIFGEMPDEYPG